MNARRITASCLLMACTWVGLNAQAEKDVYRFAVENMRVMNTKFSELSLMPHTDSTYILVSDRGGQDTYEKWLGGTPYDIYIINRNDWRDIKRPAGLNSKHSDGPVSFTNPGELYVTRTNKRGVTNPKSGLIVHHLNISFAQYQAGEWVMSSMNAFEDKEHTYAHPALSPDGKYLYLTSNMPGGFGGNDLYVSELVKGQWTTPKNLGETINTSRDETFPFFHRNGILFFSSTGHKGYGGADIFMSAKKDGAWSVPVNPGKPLNSSGHEYSIYLDENMERGFFTSNRPGGSGSEDIYAVFVDKVYGVPIVTAAEEDDIETVQQVLEVEPEEDEIPVIQNMLAGKETDFDQVPAPVESTISPIIIPVEDDVSEEQSIYETERDLLTVSMVSEDLRNIHFEVNSFVISNEAARQLDKVSALLQAYQRPVLQLLAHSDATGDTKRNIRLSELRARAVMQYLQHKEVDADRLHYRAFGESDLEVSTTSSSVQNRRVEFIFEEYMRKTEDSQPFVSGDGYSLKSLDMLEGGAFYIQVAALSSSRTFESFRMDKYGAPTCYLQNNMYKYVIGPFHSLADANAKRAIIKQDYKDAFIFLNE